jgi:hypothetical protein
MAQTVVAWRTAADAHTARAEAASLALADHEPVAAAGAVAQAAEDKAAELNERLDADELRLRQLTGMLRGRGRGQADQRSRRMDEQQPAAGKPPA